jgi:hypothetical protein
MPIPKCANILKIHKKLAVKTLAAQVKPVGKPGEWSVSSFLEPA